MPHTLLCILRPTRRSQSPMPDRKRYAIVGLGSRSRMFTRALMTDFRDAGKLVAMCDVNPVRMAYWNQVYKRDHDAEPVAAYTAERFDDMIREQKVDVVIVTTIDRTHHRYICRAMELGCDVVSEKPMTVDAE